MTQVGLTDDVRRARRRGIGSSDAPAVVGLSPWKSALEVWFEKTQPDDAPLPPQSDEPALVWGNRLEAVIADHYNDTEAPVRGLVAVRTEPMWPHPDVPFMYANVDRLLLDGEVLDDGTMRGTPAGVLEIKTAGHYQADEWTDEPPVHVLVQVQHQLAVTGLPVAVVAALVEGRFYKSFDVPRDERMIADLERAEAQFWQYVLDGVPPPVDATRSSRDTLLEMYGEWDDEPAELEPHAIDLAVRINAIEAGQKRLKEERALLENELRAMIGAHREGWVGDTKVATWSRWTQKQTDVKAMREAHPDIVDQFTDTDARDRLTVNKKVEPR